MEGRGADRGDGDELRFEANFGWGAIGRRYFYLLHRHFLHWGQGRQRPALFLGMVQILKCALMAPLDRGDIAQHGAIDAVVVGARKGAGDQMSGVDVGLFCIAA